MTDNAHEDRVAPRTAEILERVEKATPAPWVWTGDSFDDVEPEVCPHGTEWTDHGPDLGSTLNDESIITSHGYDASGLSIKTADAEFIAHARDDIPFLLDRLREAEAASLDSDELRKLRAIEKAARDLNMTMPDLGDGDPMSDLDDALADYDEWLDAQDRALLSAGDKKDELGG